MHDIEILADVQYA